MKEDQILTVFSIERTTKISQWRSAMPHRFKVSSFLLHHAPLIDMMIAPNQRFSPGYRLLSSLCSSGTSYFFCLNSHAESKVCKSVCLLPKDWYAVTMETSITEISLPEITIKSGHILQVGRVKKGSFRVIMLAFFSQSFEM